MVDGVLNSSNLKEKSVEGLSAKVHLCTLLSLICIAVGIQAGDGSLEHWSEAWSRSRRAVIKRATRLSLDLGVQRARA